MSEGLSLKINVQAGAATRELHSISNAAREASGAFAGFKTMLGGFGQIASAIGPVGVAISVAVGAAAAAAKSITSAVNDSIKSIDSLGKVAQEAGVATEQFSALAFATSFSDVSAEDLALSFKFLSSKMQDALAGSKDAVAVFQKLGVAFQNVDGSLRGPDAVFRDIVGSLAKLQDGAEKTAITVDLFGRSGQKMIPIINDNVEGLDAWAERAREAGAVISGDLAKQADEFGDSMQLLKEQFKGIFITIATELLPTLNSLASSFQGLIRDTGALRGVMSIAKELTEILIYLGQVGFGVFQTLAKVMGGLADGVIQNFAMLRDTVAGTFEYIRELAESYVDFLGDMVTKGPVTAVRDFGAAISEATAHGLDASMTALRSRREDIVSIWRMSQIRLEMSGKTALLT